jgi:HlyD family secretion protein
MAKRTRVGIKVAGWLILIAACAGAIAAYSMGEDALEVTAMTLERGYVEQTVTAIASGTVKARADATIASEFIGKIRAVHVQEGERVTKGELLLELGHEELDAQVQLAEANLRAGRARLEQVRLASNIASDMSESRVSSTEAQRAQAMAEYDRLKTLADRNLIPENELEKAALALKVAGESATSAQVSSRESAVREQEIASATASIDQLQAAVDVAVAQREKAFVRAPFDGIVAVIFVDPGEAVSMGIPLVQFVDDTSSYVEAPFDEVNVAEIAVGQKARITLDAYRDETFMGVVDYIPPIVTTNPDLSRTLNVRIRVEEGQDRFLTGMSADVVILVDERDDVVYVPTESLVRERYAFVIQDGIARQREVEPGIGNWSTREVRGGVEEGEIIITSVGLARLKDGVPVRVVDELDL